MISGPVSTLPVCDVDGDDHHDHALLGQHPAVAQHALADVADDAVDVQVAGRHPAGRRSSAVVGERRARRRPRTRARGRAARPSAAPSLAWATRWRYSPWIGHEPLGLGDRQERLELLGLGVAGGVHVGDAGVHDLGAERAAARRSPRLTLHSLPGIAWLRAGSPCRRRRSSPLVLAARPAAPAPTSARPASRWRSRTPCPAGSRRCPRCRRATVVGDVQQAELAGQAHVLLHRQPERGDDAAVGDRGVGDLLDAVEVAGEAGGDDPPAARARGTASRSTAPTLRLARGVARAPRRWSSRPAAAGCPRSVAIAPMRARSVRRPSTGVRSSLKSPECRITPCGVWNAMAKRVRHRVGDGDELDVERADHAALAVGHRDQLGAAEQAGLLDAVAGQAERQRRAVDREATARAAGNDSAADVVLVAVGGDARPRCGRRSRAGT